MPYKTCPECRQISYSAAEERFWACPCCGRDISGEAMVTDHRRLLLIRCRENKGRLCRWGAARKKRTV